MKDVTLPGLYPCQVVQLHLCALLLLQQGAAAKWCDVSIRKGEHAKEHEYQLRFLCMKNYIDTVAFLKIAFLSDTIYTYKI